MAIVDSNPVNASYTNSRLPSKQADNTFLGKQTLNRSGSGAQVDDVQQDINDLKSDVASLDVNKISVSEKGAPDGVATLDSLGKIPSSQLTVEIMEYKGVYNATTNTPSLVDGTGSTGDLYRVNVAGSQDFGSGSITFEVGDIVVYNGTVWEKWDVVDPAPISFETEFRTISGGEESAKQLTLSETPVDGAKVLVDIIGGTAQEYGVDYTISGAVLDWSGLGLDGDLVAGDKVRIHYQY